MPVPVWAHPRTSRPIRTMGMACSWIGVGVDIAGLLDGAQDRLSKGPRSAKVTRGAASSSSAPSSSGSAVSATGWASPGVAAAAIGGSASAVAGSGAASAVDGLGRGFRRGRLGRGYRRDRLSPFHRFSRFRRGSHRSLLHVGTAGDLGGVVVVLGLGRGRGGPVGGICQVRSVPSPDSGGMAARMAENRRPARHVVRLPFQVRAAYAPPEAENQVDPARRRPLCRDFARPGFALGVSPPAIVG